MADQRQQLRMFYCDSWKKHLNNEPTTALEQQVIAVIKEHPEYHAMLENPENSAQAEFFPEMGESNPFLHMGLHISIRDQVTTNRPEGFTELYQQLVSLKGVNDAEHEIMECLAKALMEGQQKQQEPDEKAYLEDVKKLL